MARTRRAPVWLCALAVAGACSKTPGKVRSDSLSQEAAVSGDPVSGPSHIVVGTVPPASGGAASIVVLEPATPRELPVAADPVVMDQVQKVFTPDILFARAGLPVEFRNSDDTLHNVNVTSDATKEQVFNVAIVPDTVYRHTFDRTGLYEAHCDIHSTMAAVIVVTASPYAKVAEPDGRVEFDDVLPGAYTATVYAGAQTLERAIDVSGARTELSLKN
jgi:plastocyanin